MAKKNNKYLQYITDEHLLNCIGELYTSYQKAKADITKQKFYKNKIDTFKLTFDAEFNELDEQTLIKTEISRQIDKSINNSIGTFHEQILGGIKGFTKGNLSGFDIKASDDTLFADLKNKHNTMNSSSAESLFQKLATYADAYKKAKCFWVQILAKDSFEQKWRGEINGKEYSHSRVYKISGDRFYKLLTGRPNAFYELYEILPVAINDFLMAQKQTFSKTESAYDDILAGSIDSKRTVLDEITFENYSYYLGFDKL